MSQHTTTKEPRLLTLLFVAGLFVAAGLLVTSVVYPVKDPRIWFIGATFVGAISGLGLVVVKFEQLMAPGGKEKRESGGDAFSSYPLFLSVPETGKHHHELHANDTSHVSIHDSGHDAGSCDGGGDAGGGDCGGGGGGD